MKTWEWLLIAAVVLVGGYLYINNNAAAAAAAAATVTAPPLPQGATSMSTYAQPGAATYYGSYPQTAPPSLPPVGATTGLAFAARSGIGHF